MRTTKETRHDFGTWCAQQGTLAADPILHDLADAVEWLQECEEMLRELGYPMTADAIAAFLREPQGEVEREL